jgi:hypothetical protein
LYSPCLWIAPLAQAVYRRNQRGFAAA